MRIWHRLIVCSAIVFLGMAGMAYAGSFTDPTVASYWGESFTDSAGNYHSPLSNTFVSGGALIAPIPTNANQASPDNNVVNYLRTGAFLAGATTYYNGSLLGDLSGKTGVTATFVLSNSALAPGAAFQAGEFVGENTTAGTLPTPHLSLVFTGAGSQSIWFSSGSDETNALAMNNGQASTLTVNFDPADWVSINGYVGNSSPAMAADFETALTGVTRVGVAFGSGYFDSDGFAFNTGGTAALQLDAIDTLPASAPVAPPPGPNTSAVPEPGIIPGTIAMLSIGFLGLGLRLRQQRCQIA